MFAPRQRRSPPTRATAWEWVHAGGLMLNLGWSTLALGGYPADAMAVSFGLTAVQVGLFGMGLVFQRAGREPAGWHPASWMLWPFLLYAALNAFGWSPVPWLGQFDWLRWVQIALTLAIVSNGILSAGPRRAVIVFVAVLTGVSVFLAAYQRFVDPGWLMLGRLQVPQFLERSSGPFGAPNSLAGYLLLVLPVAAALTLRREASVGERLVAAWVAGAALLGLLWAVSRGAWLALGTAVLVGMFFQSAGARRLTWRVRGWVLLGLAAGMAIAFSSAPARARWIALWENRGEHSRPVLWRAATQMTASAPIFGVGAGAFDPLFERYRPEGFVDHPEWAHNEYLSLVAEYGLMGGVLLAAGIVLALRRTRVIQRQRFLTPRSKDEWSRSSAFRAGAAVGLGAFLLHLGLEMHLKLPALGLLLATVVGLWFRANARRETGPVPAAEHRLLGWAVVAVAIALGAWAVPQWHGEGLRSTARAVLDAAARRGEPLSPAVQANVIEDLTAATGWAPNNAAAWSDLAAAYLASAHWREMTVDDARRAEVAAARALARSTVVAEFWIQQGRARAGQGRWVEAAEDFARALELAPAKAEVWWQYADHLSRHPAQRALALGAVAYGLRLDPGNPRGLALRQRLAVGAGAP